MPRSKAGQNRTSPTVLDIFWLILTMFAVFGVLMLEIQRKIDGIQIAQKPLESKFGIRYFKTLRTVIQRYNITIDKD